MSRMSLNPIITLNHGNEEYRDPLQFEFRAGDGLCVGCLKGN